MPKVSLNIKAEKQISNFLIFIKTISLPSSDAYFPGDREEKEKK